MIEEMYMDSIRKMKENNHFNKEGRCQYCDVAIIGMTVSETEGAMRAHLEEHGIIIE